MLLHKAVCFDVTTDVGKSIVSQLQCSVTASSFRNNTIVGTVARKVSNRVTSGSVIYEVAWNNSEIKSNKKRKGEQNNDEKKNKPREIKN